MDHAAVLAGRAAHALLIHFRPLSVEPVPIPPDWAFLIVHSGEHAQKSSALSAEYNRRRTAGNEALQRAGLDSWSDAPARPPAELSPEQRRAWMHVTGEHTRVQRAVSALRSRKADEFGRLLLGSHQSLSQVLQVSTPGLDDLVDQAIRAGALGARLTGAGFGGCAIVFCLADQRDRIRQELEQNYTVLPGIPSTGALGLRA